MDQPKKRRRKRIYYYESSEDDDSSDSDFEPSSNEEEYQPRRKRQKKTDEEESDEEESDEEESDEEESDEEESDEDNGPFQFLMINDDREEDSGITFVQPEIIYFEDNTIKESKVTNRRLREPPIKLTSWESMFKLATICQKKMFKDCQKFRVIYPTLCKINNLIGMTKTKDSLVRMISFYLQSKKLKSRPKSMQHIVLYGPPGTGKSTLGVLIAELICTMKQLKENKVVLGSPNNMIGSYVGHTSKCTQNVIDQSIGGVLLIDEAYSLDSKSTESFSGECVNTLNENLTSQNTPEKEGFVCIIIGYKTSLEQNLFSLNQGLKRRFPAYNWFHLGTYSGVDLHKMFLLMSKDCKFEFEDNISDFFITNEKRFIHHGGSVQELVDMVDFVFVQELFGMDTIPKINCSFLERVAKLVLPEVNTSSWNPMYA